jgi:hypothetical protein
MRPASTPGELTRARRTLDHPKPTISYCQCKLMHDIKPNHRTGQKVFGEVHSYTLAKDGILKVGW